MLFTEPECYFEVKAVGSGEISSPYYPNIYTPNLRCQWFLQVPDGKRTQKHIDRHRHMLDVWIRS